MLQFDPQWRFVSPGPMPANAVEALLPLVNQIGLQRQRKPTLERFKQASEPPVYLMTSTGQVLRVLQEVSMAFELAVVGQGTERICWRRRPSPRHQ
jgi:hypothetical protein